MLAILSILIIVHEIGHFSVARLFGFQTPVFGFGLPFGPHWVVGRRWGTEFRIHACLLGGYVAIPELGDESQQQDSAFGVELKPFRKFPIWQRALVAFAGVGFNILFAYLVMLTMFLTLGQPSQPTVVHSLIKSNPIAAQAGIREGDRVISLDGVKVAGPDDVVHYLVSHKMTEVHFDIVRDGQPMTIAMVTNADGKVGMALVSKGPISYTPVEGGFFQVASLAAVKLWTLTANMMEALGQLFSGLFAGGGGGGGPGKPAGIEDLHGVLAVIKIGADIAQQDWSQLFLFTIMISMDLAIINLVPWPALDGGHLAFMAVEALRGRPMGERAQGEIVKWGFLSLIVLMMIVMFNDVTALFSGKLNFKLPKQETQTPAPVPEKAPATAPQGR
jgi:regulator of sigma E protease